jgi:hypothetical protein
MLKIDQTRCCGEYLDLTGRSSILKEDYKIGTSIISILHLITHYLSLTWTTVRILVLAELI